MNNSANASSSLLVNQTAFQPEWSALPVSILLVLFTGLSGNGFLLVIFATHRTLWTPFNVYVVNLLIANLCCVVTQFPFDVYANLYNGQWLLGESLCSYYIAVSWYLQPVIFNSHQLIAINRIWAVSHPISYRRIHSIRTALFLCVGVWLYVFAGLASGLIQDAMFYRLPADAPGGCQLNTPGQLKWAVAVQIIFYIWPQIMMIIAMAVIFLAKRNQHRHNLQLKSANAVAPNNGPTSMSIKRSDMEAPPGTLATVNGVAEGQQSKPTNNAARKRSNGNGLLVLLTISVTICWTPNNVFFTWLFFEPLDAPVFYALTTILLALQDTIDPIMFTFALRSLRKVLRDLFTCRAAA